MKRVPLEEVARLAKSGVGEFEGKRNYVDTKGVAGNCIVNTRPVTFSKRPSRANMEVELGDVLLAKMEGTNKLLLISSEMCKNIYSTGFFVIRTFRSKMVPEFLYYYLWLNEAATQKDKASRGETQSAANHTRFLHGFMVPKPDIDVQRSTVRRLAKIEAMLRRLGAQEAALDGLLRAERIRTFALRHGEEPLMKGLRDPVYRYPTFYGIKYQRTGKPVIKISNIGKDGKLSINMGNYDCISDETNARFPKTILEENDVVVAVRGTYVGKVAIVPPLLYGGNISPNLVRVPLDPMVLMPEYLWEYSQTDRWKKGISTSVRDWKKKFGTIRAGQIEKACIPLPDIKLQKDSVKRLARIEGLCHRVDTDIHRVEAITNAEFRKLTEL